MLPRIVYCGVCTDPDCTDGRVSLMRNGEEVISVGGAVDPSNKNVGTAASNRYGIPTYGRFL